MTGPRSRRKKGSRSLSGQQLGARLRQARLRYDVTPSLYTDSYEMAAPMIMQKDWDETKPHFLGTVGKRCRVGGNRVIEAVDSVVTDQTDMENMTLGAQDFEMMNQMDGGSVIPDTRMDAGMMNEMDLRSVQSTVRNCPMMRDLDTERMISRISEIEITDWNKAGNLDACTRLMNETVGRSMDASTWDSTIMNHTHVRTEKPTGLDSSMMKQIDCKLEDSKSLKVEMMIQNDDRTAGPITYDTTTMRHSETRLRKTVAFETRAMNQVDGRASDTRNMNVIDCGMKSPRNLDSVLLNQSHDGLNHPGAFDTKMMNRQDGRPEKTLPSCIEMMNTRYSLTDEMRGFDFDSHDSQYFGFWGNKSDRCRIVGNSTLQSRSHQASGWGTNLSSYLNAGSGQHKCRRKKKKGVVGTEGIKRKKKKKKSKALDTSIIKLEETKGPNTADIRIANHSGKQKKSHVSRNQTLKSVDRNRNMGGRSAKMVEEEKWRKRPLAETKLARHSRTNAQLICDTVLWMKQIKSRHRASHHHHDVQVRRIQHGKSTFHLHSLELDDAVRRYDLEIQRWSSYDRLTTSRPKRHSPSSWWPQQPRYHPAQLNLKWVSITKPSSTQCDHTSRMCPRHAWMFNDQPDVVNVRRRKKSRRCKLADMLSKSQRSQLQIWSRSTRLSSSHCCPDMMAHRAIRTKTSSCKRQQQQRDKKKKEAERRTSACILQPLSIDQELMWLTMTEIEEESIGC